jgi:hypothetical protein
MTIRERARYLLNAIPSLLGKAIGTLTIGGALLWIFWKIVPGAASYITNLVASDLEKRALVYVEGKLDFYTIVGSQGPQDSVADCQGGKLIAGACEGFTTSPQAAVGPVVEDKPDGSKQIHCMRYATATSVQATAFCFRIKSVQ